MSKKKHLFQQLAKSSLRHMNLSQSEALVGGLINGLVELITNCEDEYERMNKPNKRYDGKAIVRYKRGGKQNLGKISIGDKGRGMTLDFIKRLINTGYGGEVLSDGAGRGYYKEGLQDAMSVGDSKIITGSGKEFYKITYIDSLWSVFKADEKDIKDAGLLKHGTFVEVTLPKLTQFNPHADNLKNQIKKYFSLRKMLSTEKNKDFTNTLELKFQTINGKEGVPEKLNYVEPKNNIVFNQKINFTYMGKEAEGKLTLKKMFDDNKDESSNLNFSHSGILVSGKKAIYSKTDFKSKFFSLSGEKYFGEFQCEEIDYLVRQFDHENKNNNPDHNPCPIIRQNRTIAMEDSHPFVQEMNTECVKILDQFIKKDRNEDKQKPKSTKMNQKIQKYMNKLTDLLQDVSNDFGGPTKGKLDWYTIPINIKVEEGETKKIDVRGIIPEFKNELLEMKIKEDDKIFIKIKNKRSQLKSTLKDDQFKASFEVTGLKETLKPIEIEFKIENEKKLGATIEVCTPKNRDFKKELEFEFQNYRVGTKNSRTIRCFAKYPELICKPNDYGYISYDNHKAIKIMNKDNTHCKFNIINGTNYAIAEIELKGLKNFDNTNLSIKLKDDFAKTAIHVDNKDKDESSGKFTHELVDQDLNGLRASWDPEIPTKLLISTKSKLNMRILGDYLPHEEKWKYEDSEQWDVTLKEILTDYITTKYMEGEAHLNPSSFNSSQNSAPEAVNRITYEFHKIKSRALLLL